MAHSIAPNANGQFSAIIPGTMRGCAYLIIPPLLDTLCDRNSYLLLGVETDSLEIYAITVSSGKAKTKRLTDERPAEEVPQVTVHSVSEVPNDLGGYSKTKDIVVIEVRPLGPME